MFSTYIFFLFISKPKALRMIYKLSLLLYHLSKDHTSICIDTQSCRSSTPSRWVGQICPTIFSNRLPGKGSLEK